MKKLKLIMVMLCVVVGLCGCGGTAVANIDIAKVSENAMEALKPEAELTKISDDNMETIYSKWDKDLFAEFIVYASATGATCDEIAIFKVNDEKNIEAALEMLNQRVADLKTINENYNQSQLLKLDSPAKITKGNYIFFAIGETTAEAEKAFNDSFK